MSIRPLPSFLIPLPIEIAGHQVVGALRVPARDGEVPDQAVLIGRDPYGDRPDDQAYAVWDAVVRDGEWTAFRGDYDLSYVAAVDEYMTRIKSLSLVTPGTDTSTHVTVWQIPGGWAARLTADKSKLVVEAVTYDQLDQRLGALGNYTVDRIVQDDED